MEENNTNNTESQEQENEYLVKPYNPTDPIVVFDPGDIFSSIVLQYTEQESGSPNIKSGIDQTKNDAVRYPLIKLNNRVLSKENIVFFRLDICYFLPTLDLVVEDLHNSIQNTDVPGMNNVITVVLTAPEETASKKISLDFYIKSCDFDDGKITYKASFKMLSLNSKHMEQIGDSKLSTYDMLKTLAKNCNLGFAATDKCESISDTRWRQIYSQTYEEYVTEQIKKAGVDEDSIFDCWVDQYGYIVLVNLAWVLKEIIDPKQLTIKIVSGETMLAENGTAPKNDVQEIQRMITNNSTTAGVNNLMFKKFQSTVTNKSIQDDGTLTTYYVLKYPCESNSLSIEQVQIIEESVDGIQGSNEYEYSNLTFLGADQTDGDILAQQLKVKNFFNKNRAKQMYIELEKPNYNLQRGMLVNVIIEEYDTQNKRNIIDNTENALGTEAVSEEADFESTNRSAEMGNELTNESTPVPNPALSGLYYIDQVGFEWEPTKNDIKQYMYLIPKELKNNLTNKYAPVKV